jgi:hypothetical protein
MRNRRLKLLFLIILVLATLAAVPPFAARPVQATDCDHDCTTVCDPCFGVFIRCLPNGQPLCQCFC